MRQDKLPKTERQLIPKYVGNLGLQTYDRDNLYPQNVAEKIAASKVASGCLARYVDYLEGLGVSSALLGPMKVNDNGESLNAVHAQAAKDYATFGGFALHVNYDVYGRIVELNYIPFENVRLKEPNDGGRVTKVLVHPDWSGRSTRNGHAVRVSKENVDYIDVFNPDPAVVAMQILEAGGIDHYKGQVLYFSNEGYMVYPVPVFAAALTDFSTDEGLSNISLRNARMNFLPSGVFVHMKQRSRPEGDMNAPDELHPVDGVEDSGYMEDLASVQGDTNAFKIIEFEVDSKEDVPTFVPFEGRNTDKDYTETCAEVKESIYAAFGQEGWLAIRNGKVGFSGTLMADISEEYSSKMVKSQRKMTEAYVSILSHWGGILPDAVNSQTLAIVPMVYTPAASAAQNSAATGGAIR